MPRSVGETRGLCSFNARPSFRHHLKGDGSSTSLSLAARVSASFERHSRHDVGASFFQANAAASATPGAPAAEIWMKVSVATVMPATAMVWFSPASAGGRILRPNVSHGVSGSASRLSSTPHTLLHNARQLSKWRSACPRLCPQPMGHSATVDAIRDCVVQAFASVRVVWATASGPHFDAAFSSAST